MLEHYPEMKFKNKYNLGMGKTTEVFLWKKSLLL